MSSISVACAVTDSLSLVSSAASVVKGRAVGVTICIAHLSLPLTISPFCSAGTTPARTTDDLPLPDAPTTARKRWSLRYVTSSAVSVSRPKNSAASATP